MPRHAPRALYLSHGGGPLPLLGDPGHREMIDTLKAIAAEMPKPSAIVVVSAHWEAQQPTLTASGRPSLRYDYHGFPEPAYEIAYPCPGEPTLAREMQGLLTGAGLEARLNEQRGLDHGVFVPLKIMYPEADIPCVQLSLMNHLDPAEHIRMGATLAGVAQAGLLVIGSGFSFHNMRAFFAPVTPESDGMNAAFEQWLEETCTSQTMDEAARVRRLEAWSLASGARYCHPREEHLLPLHVAYGVNQRACTRHYALRILNRRCSMYLW